LTPVCVDCAGVCLTTCLLLTAEPSYPKPSISLRPSGRVALGGAVTVRCRGRYQNMKFLLYKDGNPNALQDMEPAGDLAEFPIRNVSWRDAGSYSCYYHHKWYPFIWSRPSDPVELVVAGELPGSVSPLPAPHPAGPSGQGHVQGRKQAQVTCGESPSTPGSQPPALTTRPHSPPRAWFSSLSGSLPKPSISVSPGGVIPVGGNVTIRCQHQHLGMRILFYKDGDSDYLAHTDPAGSEAEFPITSAGREHGGSYTCRYSYRTERAAYSEPSDLVQIIVAGQGPSISLSPTGVTAPGADVTIRCQGQRRDVRFFLHKAGDLNPQRHMDPAGDGAEFRIPTVGRQHEGNYSCSYRPRSEPFVSSQPSDTVELVVAGEGPGSESPLPAPHPARPLRGLHAYGTLRARLCPEPWAQQRGRPAGERGRSHWGGPSQGGAAFYPAHGLTLSQSPRCRVPASRALSDVAPSVTVGSFSLVLSPGEVCAHRGGSGLGRFGGGGVGAPPPREDRGAGGGGGGTWPWGRRWGGLGGPWLLGELVLQPGPSPGGSSVPCPDESDPDCGRAGGREPTDLRAPDRRLLVTPPQGPGSEGAARGQGRGPPRPVKRACSAKEPPPGGAMKGWGWVGRMAGVTRGMWGPGAMGRGSLQWDGSRGSNGDTQTQTG
uniref:Ig-like domain-containing protein n=1 Tax=Terrapene triunguis TaxID=2587831 RepID=A0A674JT04_9SAUR